MPSPGRLAKILVGLAVSAGLLLYLFWNVDLRAIGAHLAKTDWGWLTLSMGFNLVSIWVRARRWFYLFPPGARPAGLFSAVMIGYMGNNLLPLRAGEIVRVYVVARRGQRFWTTLATLVVERVLDALAVVLILAGLLLAIPVPRELQWAALVFLSADLAIMAILAVMATAPQRLQGLIRTASRRWPPLETRLSKILDTFTEGLQGVSTLPHLIPIIAWSAAIWVLWALGIWVALWAAHLDLPMAAAWAVLAFVGLGVSLPSSPGFVGVIQAATVLALALFSVPHTEALSFSLLLHASQFVPVTAAGLILLIVEQVSLAEVTQGLRKPASPSRS